jgi:hypothetical protein
MSLSGMMRLPLDFKYPVKQQIENRQKINRAVVGVTYFWAPKEKSPVL